MRLHNLKRVSDYEEGDWLYENIPEITAYQKEAIMDREIIRFSHLYFYKAAKNENTSLLWRLSVIVYLPYFVALIIFLPFRWMTTGQWGYGQKFYNIHSKWTRKIGL